VNSNDLQTPGFDELICENDSIALIAAQKQITIEAIEASPLDPVV
jgi:hypothetical protein